MAQDRFSNEKYVDWVKVKLSLQYAKEGLEPTTARNVETFYNILSYRLQAPSSSSASGGPITCYSCVKADLKRQWSRQRFTCISGICDLWLNLLQQDHVDPTSTVEWDNFDVSRLPLSPWECAKVYLPYGSRKVQCAGDCDLAAILTLYLNCRHFASILQEVNLCGKVKEVRNELLHSGTMEVEKPQMMSNVRLIKQLLSDPAFAADWACQEAVAKIDKLIKFKLELSLNKELELKVLNSDIKLVASKTDQLKQDMVNLTNQVQQQCGNLRTDISGVTTEVSSLKDQLGGVTTDVSSLKDQLGRVTTDVSSLKDQLGGVTTDVSSLKDQLKTAVDNIVELQKVSDQLYSFINTCNIEKVDMGQLEASIRTLSTMRAETDRQGQILAQLQETVGRHDVTLGQHREALEQHKGTLELHEGKLQQHSGTLEQHGGTLEQHEGTLEQHGGTLDQQRGTLEQHGGTLEQHEGTLEQYGGTLEQHEGTLEQHGGTLEQHGGTLEQHGGTLEQHEETLEQHGGTLEQYGGTLKQHEGTLEQHEGTLEQHGGTLEHYGRRLEQHEGILQQHGVKQEHSERKQLKIESGLDKMLEGMQELLRLQKAGEEGQCRVEIPILNSTVVLSGKKEDFVRLAEDVLRKVLQSAIDKVRDKEQDESDEKDVIKAVQQFLSDLERNGGTGASTKLGSIILKIRCKTLQGLDNMLQFFRMNGLRYRLNDIENALNALFQEELKVELVLPEDTLVLMKNWIDKCLSAISDTASEDGAQEYKRSINLGIRCESAEAAIDVMKYLESDESANRLNQIAEAVSEVVGDKIKMEARPDVEGFSRALSANILSVMPSPKGETCTTDEQAPVENILHMHDEASRGISSKISSEDSSTEKSEGTITGTRDCYVPLPRQTQLLDRRCSDGITGGLKPEQFKQFSEAVGDFKDGHYILMASPTRPVQHLAKIGQIPWLAVFDFDQNSRKKGLLDFVENTIEQKQSVTPSTWKDKCSFSAQSTSWIFMSGCQEHPETLTSKVFEEWKGEASSKVGSLMDSLAERVLGYTEITVVCVWPDDRDHQRCMKHTLSKLEGSDITPSIVVLHDEKHKQRQLPNDDDFSKLVLIPFTLDDFINSIHSILGTSHLPVDERKYVLPTSDNTNNPKISMKDANILKEDLAVLYKDNPTGNDLKTEEIDEERDRFYKGGTLSWLYWYTFKTGGGHIDIERDINKIITEHILENHIKKWKSGFVNLYHYPGSGGTTLAQRVLWELKDTVPCAQVLHGADPDMLVENVKLLCDRTQLPVILLLDGEDDQKVEAIHKQLKSHSCIVFFRVRRCTAKPKTQPGVFYLQQNVSRTEANILCSLYKDQCKRLDTDEDVKRKIEKKIKKIAKDVVDGNVSHPMIDFGLALYDYQYKGIRSYVKSLILTEDDNMKDLFPWQKALLMLSIAHYYGQESIPCHMFGRFLKPKIKKVLNYINIPPEMKELVVPEPNEKQENVIRISHYVIAKEIIDQLLTCHRDEAFWEREVSQTLSREAKKNIEPQAVDLIKEAGIACRNTSSDTIIKLLRKIFISRDNTAFGEEEGHSYTRPRFSRIMEDVSTLSPFSERFSIMQQLINSFPEEAEFHAHLGRLYFTCRHERQDKAETCFRNALRVCIKDRTPKDDKKLRNIYHMYGCMYSVRIYRHTGKTLDDKPVEQKGDSDVIPELLEYAKNACDKFARCRDATPSGDETTYGYIDEIRTRQMFCDFAYKSKDCASIHDLREEKTDLGRFVKECYVKLDELYADCMYYVDPNIVDEKEINKLQNTHTVLFKTEGQALRDLEDRDDIESWKFRIILLKMKHGLRTSFGVLETVENKDDINDITMHYERILDEYLKTNENVNSRQVDMYFREWLFIIRHKLQRPYRLDRVLKLVEEWYEKYETQTARFYLFILKSLYGFGSKNMLGNSEMLAESQNLRQDVITFSKYVQKPKYPREWLGQHEDSFQRVISQYRFFGKIESRNVLDSNQLEVQTGTILASNKPLAGDISLDLRGSSGKSVKIFFIPAKSKLFGKSYNNRRVEFVLGFSMKHGYEAFSVKELERKTCRNQRCKKGIEFRSCDENVKCTNCGLVSSRISQNTTFF